ncbi:MAG: HAD-IB family hydrolase [Actinobacteria bacterium]|nr:MAG: HAD-IB family hydrolase [Actinomycetota bacterium]
MSAGAEPRRAAAFFDLDRTIISGSSLFQFGWVAFRNGLVPKSDLLSDAGNAVRFRLTGASDAKTEAVKNRVLEAIAGVRVETLRGLGDQIIPRLLDDVRREARGLIDLHQDAGRDTYIVSASPVEIVADFAAAMGMTGGIGTVAEVVDGIYTGRLAQPFCYGHGKAQAIEKMAAEQGYDLRLSYAYTDSGGDLPMLEVVGHPVAVNPDRALETVAYHRGWPVVEFSRARKKVVKRTTAAAGAMGAAAATYAIGRRHGRLAALRRG